MEKINGFNNNTKADVINALNATALSSPVDYCYAEAMAYAKNYKLSKLYPVCSSYK
jgi:hypothetical protein